MSGFSKTRIGIVFFLIITTIACGISFSGEENDTLTDIQLEQTRISLELTRSALEDKEPSQPESDASPGDNGADEGQDAEDEEEDDDSVCNRSKFVSETIPDYTVFEPGEKFDKTWTIRNAGTCKWTTDYTFRFTQGDRMGGVSSMNIPSVIEPNETITFKLNLTAPDKPGTYTGRWQIFAGDGEELGWYSVVIEVKPAGPPFAVTSVNLENVDLAIPACPHDAEATLSIKTNGPGEVTYQISDSNGESTNIKSLNFDAAGTKNVTYKVTVNATGAYTISLKIIEPNNQPFGPFDFFALCP